MSSSNRSGALRADELGQASELLTRALFDDPAYALVFPRRRADGLQAFFSGHLANHLPASCTHALRDADDGLLATVTVRPPGGVPLPATKLARGLFRLGRAHGLGPIRRLMWLRDVYEDLERRTGDTDRYWHVHMMAVRDDMQGRGLGSELLRDALAAVAGPEPVVLTTHKRVNVTFYERAGFEVTLDERVTPAGGESYAVWGMRRPGTRS